MMTRPAPAAYGAGVDILNDLILQAIASPWLYAVLFAVTVIDGFFPPVPSETVLVAAAAVAASTGDGNILLLGAVAALGAAIGDNIAFLIGRRLGTTRFAWMRRPRVAAAFAYAQHALDRRSATLILGARYIPIGRVAVNMSAGALGFPWRRFLPLSLIAGVSWSVFSLAIGLLAGAWLHDQPVLSAAIGVVIALIVGIVIDRIAALRRRRTAVPHLAG
ncbi:Membrane protein DedA, SNARE-associated domain [Microbacterium sp. Nx66]|nr:Membrane protein DedA, SNARE-associated domain [Microbacterium sp. Nx66]